jgi:hypothetical protein
MTPIKRPPVFDVDHALKVYYGKGYISNSDIKQIFGVKADTSVKRLKEPVKAAEIEKKVPVVVPHHVNARIAFEVWRIDVEELERNRRKLAKLGLEEATG